MEKTTSAQELSLNWSRLCINRSVMHLVRNFPAKCGCASAENVFRSFCNLDDICRYTNVRVASSISKETSGGIRKAGEGGTETVKCIDIIRRRWGLKNSVGASCVGISASIYHWYTLIKTFVAKFFGLMCVALKNQKNGQFFIFKRVIFHFE